MDEWAVRGPGRSLGGQREEGGWGGRGLRQEDGEGRGEGGGSSGRMLDEEK